MHADDLEKAYGAVGEKGKMIAEMWEKSAVLYKALQCVTYLQLGHVQSEMSNSALLTGCSNWEEMLRCKRQSLDLPGLSESQPYSVLAVLCFIKKFLPDGELVALSEKK